MLQNRSETGLLLLGDVILLVVSLWLALFVRSFEVPTFPYFTQHFKPFLLIYGVSLLIFFIAGLYERRTRLIKRILGVRIFGAQATNTVLAAVLFFIVPFTIAPKTVLVLYLLISVILISTWRFFVAPFLSIVPYVGAVLVGSGKEMEHVFALVANQPKYYVHFVRYINSDELVAGSLATELHALRHEGVELVIIDSRDERVRAEMPSLYDAMVGGMRFVEFETFYEDLFDRVPLTHLNQSWLLEHMPRSSFLYHLAKRVIDISGALVGIVIAAPFVFVSAIVLYLTGGQPFIFHERVGKHGRTFKIIKLRSMLLNDHGDPDLQKKNRVTRFGRFLRKTRIDEFPQLINILRGDISFIGPRPELPAIAEIYQKEIPYYDVRHVVQPGLSGWAQIYDYDAPRGGADVERTSRKLSYDLYYIKHRSFGLDMAIALKTLRALASFSGV